MESEVIDWLKTRSKLKRENDRLRAEIQSASETIYSHLGPKGQYGSYLGYGPDSGSDEELVRHFTLWNYVAISRIGYKIAEQFPKVSRAVNEGEASQTLSVKQMQHIRRQHGGIIQSHEELAPVDSTHPLLRLLHEVNPEDWWGTFIYETIMFWQLTGEFYWWVIPNNAGMPAQMWVIPTQWMKPNYDRVGNIESYTVTPDGDRQRAKPIPADQIITGKHKSPISKSKCHSPTAAGSQWIDNSESVEQARWNTFRNGPLPSVSIELDREQYAKPDPDVLRAVKDRFVARYGGTARAGEPIIAPPGMKVSPFSMKPAEMAFPETIDQVRDQVLALHGVPKVIAGITSDINRATIYGANLIFCENTINPLLSLLAGIMSEKLAPKFGSDLRIWFDDARPADAEAEREEVKLDWTMGAITPNERRISRGREPVDDPGADELYVTTVSIPMGSTDAEQAGHEPSRNGKANGNGQDQRRSEQLDVRRNGRGSNGQAVKEKVLRSERRELLAEGLARTSRESRRRTGGILTPSPVWQSRRLEKVSKAWHEIRQHHEDQISAAVTGYFRELSDAVAERLSGSMSSDLLENLFVEGDAQMWRKAVGPSWVRAMLAGAQFEMTQLGIEMPEPSELVAASWVRQAEEEPPPPLIDPGSPEIALEFFADYGGAPSIFLEMPVQVQEDIIQYLKGREVQQWMMITETQRKKIEKVIAEGLTEGWGGREMEAEIKSIIRQGAYKDQAMTIARTEGTSAMNHSSQTVRVVNSIPQKVWISTIDNFTRRGAPPQGFDHANPPIGPNGQTVPNEDHFLVSGELLMYPGDRSGSAGNIINCRCDASGVVDI